MRNSHHLFTDPGEMTVDCSVSGITRSSQKVKLILEDALGNRLAEADRPLKTSTAPGSYSLSTDTETEAAPALVGSVRWQPPIAGPGFYRMRAELEGHEGPVHLQDVTAAVVLPQTDSAGGEFGWTLARSGQAARPVRPQPSHHPCRNWLGQVSLVVRPGCRRGDASGSDPVWRAAFGARNPDRGAVERPAAAGSRTLHGCGASFGGGDFQRHRTDLVPVARADHDPHGEPGPLVAVWCR